MAGIVESPALPTHLQLPESDGSIVQNFAELPQQILLTDSLLPVLKEWRPDERWAIGHDSGIYWRYVAEEPLSGCKAPDWFLILGVDPLPAGDYRRSYVLWHEIVRSTILLEFVSGDGSEERDTTPEKGKFWVYERAIQSPYYGIYEPTPGRVEVYHLENGRYILMEPNERGHYHIAPLDLKLGLWHGKYMTTELSWLRWFDVNGNMLPTGFESAEKKQVLLERERVVLEQQRVVSEQERKEKEETQAKVEQLAARLRALGIDPDAPHEPA